VKKTGLVAAAFFLANVTYAQQKEFKPYTTKIPGSEISFTMTPIEAGSFTMGSPATEKGRGADEGPQKKINIAAFWMGAKEVTHDEFLLFFGDESVSRNVGEPQFRCGRRNQTYCSIHRS
jgi:formylglycine-generating enzyme required for sulfatase activity